MKKTIDDDDDDDDDDDETTEVQNTIHPITWYNLQYENTRSYNIVAVFVGMKKKGKHNVIQYPASSSNHQMMLDVTFVQFIPTFSRFPI